MPMPPAAPADPTMLGATRDSAGALINNFNGRLDEIRIWNVARTQAQIMADKNKEIVAATGLVHRWGFNEASGNAIDDPGTYDGVMTSGATRITSNLPVFGNDLCVYGNVASGTTCSDGSVCTSGETCNGSGVCGGGTTDPCGDSDLCTTDTCDPETGCQHSPVVCGPGTACSPATGLCEPFCTPTGPDTDCDGVDDDCDGTADDNYAITPTSCGAGACASTGTLSCVSGAEVDSCVAGTGSPDNDCDGVDDDCDGTADDDYASVPTTCGTGACGSTGTSSCVGGVVQSNCTPGTATPDTDCDSVDDDCDGTADDDYASVPTTCGDRGLRRHGNEFVRRWGGAEQLHAWDGYARHRLRQRGRRLRRDGGRRLRLRAHDLRDRGLRLHGNELVRRWGGAEQLHAWDGYARHRLRQRGRRLRRDGGRRLRLRAHDLRHRGLRRHGNELVRRWGRAEQLHAWDGYARHRLRQRGRRLRRDGGRRLRLRAHDLRHRGLRRHGHELVRRWGRCRATARLGRLRPTPTATAWTTTATGRRTTTTPPCPRPAATGACGATGTSSCVGGVVQSNCTPGTATPDTDLRQRGRRLRRDRG